MKTRYFVAFVLLFVFSFRITAQLVWTVPEFPTDNDEVTIYFDATQGSGGLAGYTGDVYAHTGVITENSSSSSDWKYVKTSWGQNSPETKLTRIDTDLYTLLVTPSVREYYGVPAAEDIFQMAFVFRSGEQVGGSWLEGKTESGGDIFIDLYEAGLNVSLTNPQEPLLVNLGETLEVSASATYADTLSLYMNNILINQVIGLGEISETLECDEYGKFWIKAVAKNDTGMIADSQYIFVRKPVLVQDPPAGTIEGINYINEHTVTLCLYAPGKEYAFAIGDFSNWEVDTTNYMFKSTDGNNFWVTLYDLVPGQEYIFQYWIDGSIKIGDPYADKVSDPWNDKWIQEQTYPGLIDYPTGKTTGVATVFQTAQEEYVWQTTNFEPPAKTDLVIYELLIRDYTATHTYQSIIDTLDYLVNLGINAIEFMPVSEFEGNSSWGYNPNYYFAPDKYYGPKNDFKKLVDACHEKGIAVIMDVVYNHSFGTSPYVLLWWDAANNQPAADNPFYNQIAKHDFNVGYDMNHESQATKKYIGRSLRYWLTEYKVDGFRFDLSKGFTQTNTLGNTGQWGHYDQSRINILNAYADTIWNVNPDGFLILEHLADNDEEKVLAEDGMMLWGNMNYNYCEASMGWTSSSDLTWASYKARNWNVPHLVPYMESHDEERMMFKNLTYGNSSNPDHDVKQLTIALQRVPLAAAFYFTLPGPKMIWQFGELGYDVTIDFNGRTGEKPLHWEYFDDYRRNTIYNVFSALVHLKKAYPVFKTNNYGVSLNSTIKKINLNHSDMNVTVIGNFGVTSASATPGFQHTGMWYNYFSGDSLLVNTLNQAITLGPGEFILFTDKKLESPETGLGIYDPFNIENCFNDLRVFPNPASGKRTLSFSLPSESMVQLFISDMEGRIVKTIAGNRMSPGNYNFEWSGTSDNGSVLPKGIYIAILHTETGNARVKLIVTD